LKAGYDLTYNYDKPFQISTLQDENYRTEGNIEKDKIANEHVYKYDASGERVIKTYSDNEAMFVNSVFSGARTSTDNFTAYINPYLVVSKGDNYMKHIYIGSRRIAYAVSDDDYVNGQGFCCDDNVGLRAGNDNPELFQYYYHSDYLVSTSLITNIEERNNKWNTPYLFNAKGT
jgi:hypothetical protein